MFNDNTQEKNNSKTPDRWTSKDVPPSDPPFYDLGHAKGTADASGHHPNFSDSIYPEQHQGSGGRSK